MPCMLYRYFMGELLRVFLLSATVLVLVVAFGAAIKPLAADDLGGPLQVAKYITLAIVPMLQFAIPFAAGFAATLVMHRYTADNEILAASVSGLSYKRILMPIFAFGCVLFVVMVFLTQTIIPRFWQSLQQMIARDVTRLIQSSIKKGEPIRFGLPGVVSDEDLGGEDNAPPDLDVGPGPERRLGSGSMSEPEEDVGVTVLGVEVEVVPGDDLEILAGGGPVNRERGANRVAELGRGSGRSAHYARVLVPPGNRRARSMLTSTQPASAWRL